MQRSVSICLYSICLICDMRVRGGVSDIHLQAGRSMRCEDGRRADTFCRKRLCTDLLNVVNSSALLRVHNMLIVVNEDDVYKTATLSIQAHVHLHCRQYNGSLVLSKS